MDIEREQAFEDGILVDISPLAKEAGFIYPVAVTDCVWAILNRKPMIRGWRERAWSLLMQLGYEIFHNKPGVNRLDFSPLFGIELTATCGPDNDGNPAFTIMLKGEGLN